MAFNRGNLRLLQKPLQQQKPQKWLKSKGKATDHDEDEVLMLDRWTPTPAPLAEEGQLTLKQKPLSKSLIAQKRRARAKEDELSSAERTETMDPELAAMLGFSGVDMGTTQEQKRKKKKRPKKPSKSFLSPRKWTRPKASPRKRRGKLHLYDNLSPIKRQIKPFEVDRQRQVKKAQLTQNSSFWLPAALNDHRQFYGSHLFESVQKSNKGQLMKASAYKHWAVPSTPFGDGPGRSTHFPPKYARLKDRYDKANEMKARLMRIREDRKDKEPLTFQEKVQMQNRPLTYHEKLLWQRALRQELKVGALEQERSKRAQRKKNLGILREQRNRMRQKVRALGKLGMKAEPEKLIKIEI